MRHTPHHSRSAFTLVELLIVIGVIAILATVVVIVINPAQLLAQSRDSNRISDMTSLDVALADYQSEFGGSMGTANIIYVSLPDSSSTCGSWNLPTAPTGYSYQCASLSNYKSANGTGWIPLNLSAITPVPPLTALPTDPTNSSSSRLYYTYTTNGSSYEITAVMESAKYKLGGSGDVVSTDGGQLVSTYEKGTAFGLEPMDVGDSSLVGYWPLNEGTGTVAYDYSGSNGTGTWNGTTPYYMTGKIGPYAGDFNGTNDYISIPDSSKLDPTNFTVSAWIDMTTNSTALVYYPVGKCAVSNCSGNGWGLGVDGTYGSGVGSGCVEGSLYIFTSATGVAVCTQSNTVPLNTWVHIAATYNAGSVLLYINGVQKGSGALSITQNSSQPVSIGKVNTWPFSGLIDDVRIYNRVLSSAEILAMYNGSK